MWDHSTSVSKSSPGPILLAVEGRKTFRSDCEAEEVPCSISTLVPARRVLSCGAGKAAGSGAQSILVFEVTGLSMTDIF